MGTLFLVDSHMPVILDSEINDTIPVELGETQILNGSFGVNVSFGTPMDGTPANLTELLAQKFVGTLALYPGYAYIDYDEGIDSSGWDPLDSQGASLGDRGTTYIVDQGYMTSNAVALTGGAPLKAVVTWEVFEVLTANPKDGALIRRYEEGSPSDLIGWASFDGGTSWVTPVLDGVPFDIPAFSQGTNFVFRLQNGSGKRLWVGSWAVIY